jgi:hypothetical protein
LSERADVLIVAPSGFFRTRRVQLATAWGPDFKRSFTVRTPASNVDLVPTLLALMNLDKNVPERFDGRALREAFVDGPDEEQVPIEVRTYFVETPDGGYRAAIQVTELEHQRYIDKCWRVR